MKYCNCGNKMELRMTLPKQYSCPKCGATLIIDDSNGIQRWYDKDGKQCTYQPPEK